MQPHPRHDRQQHDWKPRSYGNKPELRVFHPTVTSMAGTETGVIRRNIDVRIGKSRRTEVEPRRMRLSPPGHPLPLGIVDASTILKLQSTAARSNPKPARIP